MEYENEILFFILNILTECKSKKKELCEIYRTFPQSSISRYANNNRSTQYFYSKHACSYIVIEYIKFCYNKFYNIYNKEKNNDVVSIVVERFASLIDKLSKEIYIKLVHEYTPVDKNMIIRKLYKLKRNNLQECPDIIVIFFNYNDTNILNLLKNMLRLNNNNEIDLSICLKSLYSNIN